MLDFGLAKLATGSGATPGADDATRTSLDMTTPGTVMGTVSYMSPEQALGKPLDTRTDIFSLGVVLYEMITGRRAFEGDTSAAVFDAILSRAPTAPVELNARVPAELERIVKKALEKDPALRYQSAADLRADLKRLQRQPAPSPRKKSRLPILAAGGVAILVVAAFLVWQGRDGKTSDASDAAPPVSKGPFIAVLPFTEASNDSEQAYFGSGLAQEIITELTRYPDLNVIARHSSFGYQGDPNDLARIRMELGGVRYVLRGNVVRAGDTIRVNAELSDTQDGTQLWAHSYTRELTAGDFFALQDELTQQVVGVITSSYGPISRARLAEARRKPPESLDSYDCILRTYEYLHVHTAEKHLVARECLERVVEQDPDYPDAWAWLGYIYSEEQRHRWNLRADEYDALERALVAAQSAVDLDPTNQVARGALALTHFNRRDADRFRVEAERAIALNPNNELWLAYIGLRYCDFDDCDRGIPMIRKALELNPHPPAWYYFGIFWDHYSHGRYQAAQEAAFKLRGTYRRAMFLAATSAHLGRADDVRRHLADLRARPDLPDDIRTDMIELGYAASMVDRLLEGLRRAEEL
jgi:TolB-like protein/Tfp pilus assembly protein PilF